uniref:NTR domain-containing protein n=1 Tax=Salarias fasciatus TaxID=181472 RepID=A0A672HAI9_SALFA
MIVKDDCFQKALRVSEMELKEVVCAVIMAGNTDVGPMGKLRSFLSHQHCRGAVGLQKGKTYLIMGSKTFPFWYMLDEKTWVEYWPTTEECQTDEHRPSCSGLKHMVDQFQVFSLSTMSPRNCNLYFSSI